MIISLGQTRWLTMEYAVSYVLDQHRALRAYFQELCESDPTTTHNVILYVD